LKEGVITLGKGNRANKVFFLEGTRIGSEGLPGVGVILIDFGLELEGSINGSGGDKNIGDGVEVMGMSGEKGSLITGGTNGGERKEEESES
jgi:hypothetical protein